MKITKILRGLLIALSIMMIFALVACNDNEVETSDTSESISESESVSESVSDSASESESESASETEKETCKHTNTTLNDKCDKICSDCNATVKTGQHVAGNPDANDKCNVKCTNCGKVMKANQHTAGKPDANDNCNVKCTVCNETIKTAQHTRGDGKPDVNDECRIKCPVCSTVLSQSHGETSATWTAVPGVAEDGKLYETKNCVDCGTIREKRVVANTGYLNTVKLGSLEVEKSKAVGATITLAEGKNSGDVVVIAGWIGINGGVEKYVYRVIDANGNATAWIDAAYDVAPQNMDATAHKSQISAITGAKLGISGYEANAIFTDGIKTGDLISYLGQTITVEFAVIPANNKGTAEAPNTIVVATVSNFKVACSHAGNTNEYKLTAANPQWLVCESCSICGAEDLKVVTDKTLAGLHMFSPSYIASKKGTLTTDENGFSYVRINSTKDKHEENVTLFSDANQPIENVGRYLAIVYRSTVSDYMDFYIDSTTTSISETSRTSKMGATGDRWSLVVQDLSSVSKYDGEKLVALRFDYFNDAANRTNEDYVDVAYIAFFASKEEAEAYYKAYVDAYLGAEGCGHYSNDKVWIGVEGQPGKIACTCNFCGGYANITDCGHNDSEKLTVIDDTHTIFDVVTCGLCGLENVNVVSGKNQEELHVFTPKYISSKKGTLMAGSNGLEFVRIMSTNPANAEENFTLFADATSPLTNVDRYIAVLYRSSVDNKIEIFADYSSTIVTKSVSSATISASEQWQLVIIDTDAIKDRYDGSKLVALRFDYFNNGANKRTTSDYVDVAFISFFANKEDAYEYYKAYVEEYIGEENCDHEYADEWTFDSEKGKLTNTCLICAAVVEKDCEHADFNGEWTRVEGEVGKLQNTCATCGGVVVKDCVDHTFTGEWTATENAGEIKNTCAACGTEVVKVCDHKKVAYTATSNPFVFNSACAECKKDLGEVSNTNTDGKYMFDADTVLGAHNITAPTSNLKLFSSELKTEGDMKYIRFEVKEKISSETFFYFASASTKPISGAGAKFVIMYRASKGIVANWDLFISNTTALGGTNKAPSKALVLDEEWHLVIFDMPEAFDTTKSAGAIRLDMFNGAAEVGAYVDIAYAGFFNSDESAKAFYGAYLDLYGLCKHTEFTGEWIGVEGQIGQIQNTCATCGDTVVKDCVDHTFTGEWTGVEGQVGKIQNTCAVCGHIEIKACDHSDASKLEKDDTHAIYDVYNCTLCGVEGINVVSDKNQEENHVFTPEYISNKKGTLITDENGLTYVRIMAVKTSAAEEFVWLYENAETLLTGAGKYMAILFRTSVKNQFEIYIDSKTTSIKKNLYSSSLSAGDQWQLVIIDLKVDDTYYDGENVAALRFDYFNNGANNRTEVDYVDIAFVSFFDSAEAVHEYYSAYVEEHLGEAGCGHYSTNEVWTGVEGQPGKIACTCNFCGGYANITDCGHNDSEKLTVTDRTDAIFDVVTCALCGLENVKIVSNQNQVEKHVFTPEYISSKKGTLKTDASGMEFIRIMSTKTSGEEYFTLFANKETPLTNVGRYIAILYRSSVDNNMELFVDYASVNVTSSVKLDVKAAEGQWQLVIFDTNSLASSRYNGEKLVALRLDYFNGTATRTTDDYVDIAFISFFASEDEANAYYRAYLEEYGFCQHGPVTGEWAYDAEKGKLTNTCAACGEEVTKDCAHDTLDGEWTYDAEKGKFINTCATCSAEVTMDCKHDTFTGDWTYDAEKGKFTKTCATCGFVDEKDCDHKTYTGNWVLDVELGKLTNTCAICGSNVEMINDNYVFDADAAFDAYNTTAPISNHTYIDSVLGEIEGGIKFVHFEVTEEIKSEKHFYITNASGNKVTNAGVKFAIMYRGEGDITANWDLFVSNSTAALSGTNLAGQKGITLDGKWHLVIFDMPESFDASKAAATIRLDLFNGKGAVGAYVDIAYAGFFDDDNTAKEFYKAYLRLYDVCGHSYDSEWTPVEGEAGKKQNTCTICDKVVVEACVDHNYESEWTPVEGEVGKTQNTCTICNKVVIEACVDHNYESEWTPVEGQPGMIKDTCTLCGYDYVEECTNHTYEGEWTPVDGEIGKTQNTCTLCNKVTPVDCVDHNWAGKWTPTENAEEITNTCTKCGYVAFESCEHEYNDQPWTSVDGEYGKITNTCDVCGYVDTRDCDHPTYKDEWTGTGEVGKVKNTCALCEDEVVKDCDHPTYKDEWTGTGEAGKVKNTCNVCAEVVVEDCHGHEYTGEWTGTGEIGKVQNTCTVCSAVVVENCEDHEGHKYSSGLVGVDGQPGKIAYVCETCGYADRIQACDHTDNTNTYSHNAGNPQTVISASCSVCAAENVTRVATTTPQGLMYFGADDFAAKKGTLITEDNGFKYVRLTDSKSTGEVHFTLYKGTEDDHITNGGKYIAILIRKNVLVGDYLDVFFSSSSTTPSENCKVRTSSIAAGDTQWKLFVYEIPTTAGYYDGENVMYIRFDFYNHDAEKVTTGRDESSYVDVAYMACFDSKDDAYAYYADYVEAYLDEDNCLHFNYSGEWEFSGTEGKLQNVCSACGGTVLKDCPHADAELTPTNDPFTFNSTCNVCTKVVGEVKNTNSDGNYMYNADKTLFAYNGKSNTDNDGLIKAEKLTENEMEYIHFEVTTEFSGEGYFYFVNSKTGRINNAGTQFAIMYRASEGNLQTLDCYINNGTSVAGKANPQSNIQMNEEWNLLIFDVVIDAVVTDGAGALRFDMFNTITSPATVHPVGTYFDIAYAGFFDSTESAQEFYAAYLELYGLNEAE